MPLGAIDSPELESIQIRLPGSGPQGDQVQFNHFLAYQLHEHYLIPSSAFWFDLDQDELSDYAKKVLVVGAGVEVAVNDNRQVSGFIDRLEIRTGRGGTVWHIECRDWLSPAVDAHVDPTVQFSHTATLDQFLNTLFSPFGVTVLTTDSVANRNIITGRIYGNPVSKTGKPLKNFALHEAKPYPNEGVWAFGARVLQRFGLYPRPANDGQTLICAQPDYSQDPRYEFRHSVGDPSQNNIVEGYVSKSRTDQPSVIFCSGFGGGQQFAKSRVACSMVNPTISIPANQLAPFYSRNPSARKLTPPSIGTDLPPYFDPNARPLFLYDPESHTQEQIEHFCTREMAKFLHQSFIARYTIEGHRLNGQPICVDTIAQVNDDRSAVSMLAWVLSRTFEKRAGESGTQTHVELIRPGSLVA